MYKPARKNPHRHEIHDEVRLDDYFWMRERDTEPVLEYLREENRRTEEGLAPIRELEKTLYREMRSRVKEDDSSVPVWDSGYWYYWRFESGQEYPLHCRKKAMLEAPEEIYLNENVEARGQSYFQVGEVAITSDHRVMAYAVDTQGRRIYDIFFKDLSTGEVLNDKISSVTPNIVWAEDHRTLFYTRQDPETLRSYQIYRYEVGAGREPELVYEEKDTTFNVSVEVAKSKKFLFIVIEKRDSDEVRYVDARTPRAPFQVFWPREMHHEYSVEDGGDRFLIRTNWNAKNFRLMEASYGTHARDQWREVVPHSTEVFIERTFDTYEKFIVLSERENGLTQLAVLDRTGGSAVRRLKFPDPVYDVEIVPLPDFQSHTLRFRYQSPVQPPSVYDEDLDGQRVLKKVREVPGYQADLYEARRLWATAKDGTRIPISLVKRKDRALNGGPALLYGYGSYGLSMDALFRGNVLSLLDRGFVFAIAHIRGGSEMGRDWYEKGRLQHKMNTFTDFIACAEQLIGDRYTSPQHLHIMGGSAGGLLVGAVMNLRPDLFKSVLAAVPFVDVLTTMLDESIPLTTGEYNEWGDPRIREQYLHMREYSPYDNVESKPYPHVLVTTGYHDSQVQYWEPAKWVAKLREMKTDDNTLLLYTELDAGHSGASGRFEALKLLAKEYGFILMLEGILT